MHVLTSAFLRMLSQCCRIFLCTATVSLYLPKQRYGYQYR